VLSSGGRDDISVFEFGFKNSDVRAKKKAAGKELPAAEKARRNR
jgi:hypothetical protein